MADHTFSAAIQIADARIAAGQPITEDLMHDLRDRDQEAVDVGLEQRMLFDVSGSYVNAGSNPLINASVALGAGPSGPSNLFTNLGITIPDGVTQIEVDIYAFSSVSSANHKIRVSKDGGPVEATWASMGGAIDWQGYQTITATAGADHVLLFECRTENGGGGATYTLRGIRIRTL